MSESSLFTGRDRWKRFRCQDRAPSRLVESLTDNLDLQEKTCASLLFAENQSNMATDVAFDTSMVITGLF